MYATYYEKTAGEAISDTIWDWKHYAELGAVDDTLEYDSDDECSRQRKYVEASKARNLVIADFFQVYRTDKRQIFQRLLARLYFLREAYDDTTSHEDLAWWFNKHPIDVDEKEPSSRESIGTEIVSLIRSHRTLGLKVAKLVQKRRTLQTAVHEFLFNEWLLDSAVFNDMKAWFLDNPSDVDNIKICLAPSALRSLYANMPKITQELGTARKTVPDQNNDANYQSDEYTVGEIINYVLKDRNRRTQTIELAGLTQKFRTNKTTVLMSLFDVWLQDDSVFEELKLWFEKHCVNQAGFILLPKQLIQQAIDKLAQNGEEKVRRLMEVVSSYQFADQEK